MKKILTITMIILSLSLIACNENADVDINTNTNAKQQSQIKIENENPKDKIEENPIENSEDIIEIDNDIKPEVTNTYPIVDTNITSFYSSDSIINAVSVDEDYYGQDANYFSNPLSYTDNNNGTITDNVTGLMWQKTMDIKMTYEQAVDYAKNSQIGDYDDWRIPTIKELFSLIDYTGSLGRSTQKKKYIDENYFDQPYGDTSIGEREIDAQVWSSTKYTGTTMGGVETIFGVNFIDGRIKGYPSFDPRNRSDKKMYFRLVRGNTAYGINDFTSNNDGTITDLSTGLMWQAFDDGQTRDWQASLAYAEQSTLAGYDDWRLPSAKELQSIVDYTKSPQATNSPAIDELFTLTEFIDSKGDNNFGYYWTSTTHLDGQNPFASAAYVCFGEGIGQMRSETMDVHGAGALRSDPKSGDVNDYPQYFGPQGDERRVYNYALLVRSYG